MPRTPTRDEILSQIPEARAAAAQAEQTEPRAKSARYNETTGRVEVELQDGCLFAFPAEMGEGLRGATAAQLAAVEVEARGYGLHWEELDADLSVPGLIRGLFGSKAWMRELARSAGQVTSYAKAAAARENGKKGGRPRRQVAEARPALSSPEVPPGAQSGGSPESPATGPHGTGKGSGTRKRP